MMRKLRVVIEQHVSGSDNDYSARDFAWDVRHVFDEAKLLAQQNANYPKLGFGLIRVPEFNMLVAGLGVKNPSLGAAAVVKAEASMQRALREAERAIQKYNAMVQE